MDHDYTVTNLTKHQPPCLAIHIHTQTHTLSPSVMQEAERRCHSTYRHELPVPFGGRLSNRRGRDKEDKKEEYQKGQR